MKVHRNNNILIVEDEKDTIYLNLTEAQSLAYDLLKETAKMKREEHERATAKRMVHG